MRAYLTLSEIKRKKVSSCNQDGTGLDPHALRELHRLHFDVHPDPRAGEIFNRAKNKIVISFENCLFFWSVIYVTLQCKVELRLSEGPQRSAYILGGSELKSEWPQRSAYILGGREMKSKCNLSKSTLL